MDSIVGCHGSATLDNRIELDRLETGGNAGARKTGPSKLQLDKTKRLTIFDRYSMESCGSVFRSGWPATCVLIRLGSSRLRQHDGKR